MEGEDILTLKIKLRIKHLRSFVSTDLKLFGLFGLVIKALIDVSGQNKKVIIIVKVPIKDSVTFLYHVACLIIWILKRKYKFAQHPCLI